MNENKMSLYTQKLCDYMSTYIVDNVCIKRRAGNKEDLSVNEIQNEIKNYNNIGVQTNKKIEMYCDKDMLNKLKSYFEINIPHTKGNINIITKDKSITV